MMMMISMYKTHFVWESSSATDEKKSELLEQNPTHTITLESDYTLWETSLETGDMLKNCVGLWMPKC